MSSMAELMAGLTQAQKETVLRDVVEELKVRFAWYTEGLEEALALPKMRGEELLAFYRARPEEQWSALAAAFPEEAARQRREQEQLERRQLGRANLAVGDREYVGVKDVAMPSSMLPAPPQLPQVAGAPGLPVSLPNAL